jgi:hypothetical protein
MEEEVSTGGNTPAPGSNPGNTGSSNFYIVGYNMLALTIYTLALKFSKDLAGYIFDALLLVVHVFVCVILAIAAKGPKVWIWVLSAVLVLTIGISTCVFIPPFLK